MLLAVLAIFLGALIAPFTARYFKKYVGLLLALVPFAVLLYFLPFYKEINEGTTFTYTAQWIPSLDIQFSFFLDGLSYLFTLLILGIGTIVFIYSNGYMQHEENKGRFYSFMLAFTGAMLGLVLSQNIITLFLFWEITSITSFLLIGFYHKKSSSRAAALQALLVTEFGGLSLLAAFIMIGSIGESYELTDLLANNELLTNHPLYLPILLLFLVGAFTKSAQFPFHFWLPSAMAAPTPVSSYLHSAAMVNAGIYLLARFHPILGNTIEWQNIITLIGCITMVVGAYLSLTQKDLKAILAYTTISALGILTMLIGIGTYLSFKATLIYLIVHAFYKATLFMVAGTIDKKAGTRNIDQLGNLKTMPLTTLFGVMALISMAGLPPMLGYIGKEFIYEAGKKAAGISDIVVVLSVIANIFMVAISLHFAYSVFFKKKQWTKKISESSIIYWIGPAVLSSLSLLLVIFPAPLEPLLEITIGAVKAVPMEVELELWHGFNIIFILSLITILLGITLFAFRAVIFPFLFKVNQKLFVIDLSSLFNRSVGWFISFAKKNTSFFQHGYYRFYLMVVLILTAVLVWYQLYYAWDWSFLENNSAITFYAASIALITGIAAVAVVFAKSRLIAIVTMGVVGYGIALIFMFYGAVDLAITQILVETLTLVLFVMVFHKLPQFVSHLTVSSKVRDAVIALSVGGFMAGLALKANKINISEPVSNLIAEKSFTEGFGRNIINVILVDFRAFDTLGEALVLAVASLGIFTLLKLKLKRKGG
ncbi:MAG: hydrogen gas-evolving membrane-bound hydrogenase subunit E [Candidatus Cyclobacteriaceae bacterium M2_1C_046]